MKVCVKLFADTIMSTSISTTVFIVNRLHFSNTIDIPSSNDGMGTKKENL